MAVALNNLHSAAYKTVEVFSKIIGRRIYLQPGDVHTTITDYIIVVPFDDPYFYQRVEHGISHILFGSDALARDTFVFQYVAEIEDRIRKRIGTGVRKQELQNGVRYLLGLLEFERVTSLWSKLYRGSAMGIREFRGTETQHLIPDAHRNVLWFFTCLATGHEQALRDATPNGTLWRFGPIMLEALEKVRYGTFQTSLVVTKWLVMQLVDELLAIARAESGRLDDIESEDVGEGAESADFEERSAALNQLGEGMVPPSSQEDTVNDFKESKYKAPDAAEKAREKAVEAINAPVEDMGALEQQLQGEKAEMGAYVEHVREKVIRASVLSTEQAATQDAKAKVSFVDVGVEDADTTQESYELTLQDKEVVARMRAYFFQVMGRQRQVLEDMGSSLDITAYIERKVSRRNVPIFRTNNPGRGFECMLLLDRSTSMVGEKTAQCERGYKIIRDALDFPFVTQSVWGFTSPETGAVEISRFDEDVESLYTKITSIRGSTPLHVAIRVAVQYLNRGTRSKKHLFVLTDGAPMFWRRDGEPIAARTLQKLVRTEINLARTKGIGVTTLVIKDVHGLPEGLTIENVGYMLGPARHWRVLEGRTFGMDLANTVTGSFTEYLRRG